MPLIDSVGGFNVWMFPYRQPYPRVMVAYGDPGLIGRWVMLGDEAHEPFVVDPDGLEEWKVRRMEMVVGARQARYRKLWREMHESASPGG